MKVIALTSLIASLALLPAHPRARADDPYAKAVVFAEILNGNAGNNRPDPSSALGAPDGVAVSLGGPGASILLDMGADTPVLDGPGPDLEVREIGAAFGGVDESYRVLVSNSADTNTFLFVGIGRALSLIDIAPSGLESARFVWLQDIATETLNTQTPGSDIDSVRSLHVAGGSDDLPAPANVRIELTPQGARISWMPSPAPDLSGYAIRRSLDGISFGSSPDATPSMDETAWVDTSLPVGEARFYAVSALSGPLESPLVVLGIPVTTLPLPDTGTVHLGDNVLPNWEVPDPVRTHSITFTLPAVPGGSQVALELDVFDTDSNANAIIVNGARVASLPVHSPETWSRRIVALPAAAFQPGINTLLFAARTSGGAVTGALDDFMLRNLVLHIHGGFPAPTVLTSTRFTTVTPGSDTVTLRWLVEQTPTLSPPDWRAVSSPIEWTGEATADDGFFRLREQP